MQRIQEISKNATNESKIQWNSNKTEKKIQFTIFSAPFSFKLWNFLQGFVKKNLLHTKLKTITELTELHFQKVNETWSKQELGESAALPELPELQ